MVTSRGGMEAKDVVGDDGICFHGARFYTTN